MPNEIQVTASLQYTNAAANIAVKSLMVVAGLFGITGKVYSAGVLEVPTTAGGTPIPVTGLDGLGWAMFKNNDPEHYVDLLSAVNGALFARLMPGEPAVFRFHPLVTAPAALANIAPVPIEYLILEN